MSETILKNTIHYKIPLRGLKFSTNKIYAGIHWTKRAQIKDGILSVTAGFCRPIQKVKSYPVQISYRFIFGSRALDTLNTAAMAKMFEDSFRTLGIIEDDSPKFVGKSELEVIELSRTRQAKPIDGARSSINKEDQDWVEITISPYELK